MPGPAPQASPRPSGGFNQGLGGFGEHLDEQAMQQAVQQKALSQQATNQQQAVQQGQGGHKAQQDLTTAQEASGIDGGVPTQPVKPRQVGSLTDELVKRPAQDIVKGLMSIFDINSILGVNPQEDPQTQVKKQQMHQRWQKLTQEQQQVAQQRYQQEMQKKKMEEEEKQQRQQALEQQKAQSIAPPTSPKKGPAGPGGSKKQKAVTKLQQDRKQLGGPQSAN